MRPAGGRAGAATALKASGTSNLAITRASFDDLVGKQSGSCAPTSGARTAAATSVPIHALIMRRAWKCGEPERGECRPGPREKYLRTEGLASGSCGGIL